MRIRRSALVAAPFLALAAALPASADNTGLEAVHQLKNEGGKLCMVGHVHYGQGHSQKSKGAAQREAILAWANFVALEYGTDWWHWRIAADRSMKCERSNGVYNCYGEGRPCRQLDARPGKAGAK